MGNSGASPCRPLKGRGGGGGLPEHTSASTQGHLVTRGVQSFKVNDLLFRSVLLGIRGCTTVNFLIIF